MFPSLRPADADGTKNGFEIELTRVISEAVNVSVIASGGRRRDEKWI